MQPQRGRVLSCQVQSEPECSIWVQAHSSSPNRLACTGTKAERLLCGHTTDNRHIPASVKESYLRIFISGHIPGTTCVVAGVGGHENRKPEKLYSGDLGLHFQCLFKFY